MPQTHRLKHSFTSGELSPLMEGRVDFKRFNNGCRKLYNAVCLTQGAATNRPGSEYIYDITSLGVDLNNPEFRQIPFVFSEEQAYDMVFFRHTDGSVRVVFGYQSAGLVVYEEMVTNGDGSSTDGWDALSSATLSIVSGRIRTTNTAALYGKVSQALTTIVGRTYAIGSTVFQGTTTGPLNYRVGTTPTGVDLIASTAAADGVPTTDSFVATTTTSYITFSGQNIDTEYFEIDDITCVPDGGTAGAVVNLTLPTTWEMGFDFAQSADELYCAMSGLMPQVIQRYAHDVWEHSVPSFTAAPTEWTADDGYPERVTFHQQRLVFGANLTYRQTGWASKSGSFLDFGISAPLVDSDAITFTLDSGTQNKIMWVLSVKELNIGTMGGEWTVRGGTLNAITPTNLVAERQTGNGSEPIAPLVIGNSVLFVERHGRTVNEFVYDSGFESFKNFDITILAPHLTQAYGITDWCYQQTPHSIVWSVRDDGDMLGLTFQREHEVIGWHHHETQGIYKDLNTIPGTNREDEVWMIVRRTIDLNVKYYLERMAPFYEGTDLEELRYLDSFIVYEGSATDTITGLGHLEGMEVGVLANGSVHPVRTVSSAQITLDADTYTHVVVGLAYESEIRPFVPDVSTTGGTSLGRTQRITNVDIMLHQSSNMWVGRDDQEDGEFEEEKPFRSPWDNTGVAAPLFSGIMHLDFPEGFDRKSEYFIRQKDPYPLTVLSIIDTVEVFE